MIMIIIIIIIIIGPLWFGLYFYWILGLSLELIIIIINGPLWFGLYFYWILGLVLGFGNQIGLNVALYCSTRH